MMARVLEGDVPSLADRRVDLPARLVDAIGRCLRKAPADRFQSASEVLSALEAAGGGESRTNGVKWWQIHQCVIVALYVSAAAAGWQLKAWLEMTATTAAFMALGIGATIGCVLRGHMLFTERVNRSRLALERQLYRQGDSGRRRRAGGRAAGGRAVVSCGAGHIGADHQPGAGHRPRRDRRRAVDRAGGVRRRRRIEALTPPYSTLSACIGEIDAARPAGMRAATSAQTASAPAAIASARGWHRCRATHPPAALEASGHRVR